MAERDINLVGLFENDVSLLRKISVFISSVCSPGHTPSSTLFLWLARPIDDIGVICVNIFQYETSE